MRSFSCAAPLAAAPFRTRSFLSAALLATSLAGTVSAQDAPAPGFSLGAAAFPGAPAFGATTTLANGEFVVFDGLDLFHYASDGALIAQLGSLDDWAFPSFVLATPDESEIYFGESSTGKIYRLAVEDSGSPDLVGTLPFNYDAAFSDGAELFVSAATCGLSCGNEIWSIDTFTLQPRLVASVPGASGPIVCDSLGGLCYGTVSAAFPPPPLQTWLYRWSAAQLAGPGVLSLADAKLLGGGYEGAARLAFDGRIGALYLVENNFGSGSNRILRVLGPRSHSPVLVEGQPFRSISNLCLQAGTGPAQFRAFQPQSDAVLTYTTSDFVAPPERFAVQPLRPSASLSGPGTSVPGPFALELQGGPPHGFARVLLFPSGGFHPPERVRLVAGLPLFLGLDRPLAQAALGNLKPLRLDANGGLEQGYTNPGGLIGRWAAQLVLYDAQGRLAGTSTAAFL